MQPPANLLKQPPPCEPIRDVISPERYLESLEEKLKKVKGKQTKEPTAKEMLSALGRVKEDQMHHFMNNPQGSKEEEVCLDGAVVSSHHTGKQQNVEEIVAIIYHDTLSKQSHEDCVEKG